jgi:hypothetical protein
MGPIRLNSVLIRTESNYTSDKIVSSVLQTGRQEILLVDPDPFSTIPRQDVLENRFLLVCVFIVCE